jgi:ketosteroid isomerase-like protein
MFRCGETIAKNPPSERTSNMRPNRVFLISILAATLLALLSFAEQQPDSASKVAALETKWRDGYKQGDVAAMASLLADDFIATVDGETYSKSGYIARAGENNARVEISELLEPKIRVSGNVAIVTGTYHEKGQTRGKSYDYRDNLTDTWSNSDGHWQVLASHRSTPTK